MLVLTRRLGEEIVLDGNIRVTVVAIQGERVRLGFTAPGTVPIARQELLERSSENPSSPMPPGDEVSPELGPEDRAAP